MSDLIFKTKGKETYRIPFPTPGTKCPETQLEIKMTEKITLELTLDELKLIDKHLWISVATKPILEKIKNAYPVYSFIEEAYKDAYGEYPSGTPSENPRWDAFLRGYQATQPKAVPVEEPTKPMDNVVERLVKKYQAQKLYNILKDRWCFSEDACEEIVEAVAEWLPEPQSADGSQNVDTELLVDGFNHCLSKIKEMLR